MSENVFLSHLRPNKLSNKRLSSNAHANQLFRSSPTNGINGTNGTNGTSPSSRRSSLSYESDDMTNEQMSLEEDVFDLTQKIQSLQEQVTALSESQTHNDDRYVKVKQENANLLAKIHSLEEQLREIEIQSDERRTEEQRRYKDAMARHEREKSQESEQYISRIYALQQELLESRDESRKFQNIIERLKCDKTNLEEQLNDKAHEIGALTEEVSKLRDIIRRYRDDECASNRIVDALNQELTDLRNHHVSSESSRQRTSSCEDIDMGVYFEFKHQMKTLKDENSALREANEELQAQLLNNHLEEGRILLRKGEAASSLASEIGNLNHEQLKMALREQQEVNHKLRSYIDGILLSIVENYPQLLEVKSK